MLQARAALTRDSSEGAAGPPMNLWDTHFVGAGDNVYDNVRVPHNTLARRHSKRGG
ncbi:hypothetical protein THIOKS12940006 [Thiocapsa sp. KS1]|nr:hypothetical protein THIOKS12940006 [Thiocapsa sp. KS1]